jgi:hypothetical protein
VSLAVSRAVSQPAPRPAQQPGQPQSQQPAQQPSPARRPQPATALDQRLRLRMLERGAAAERGGVVGDAVPSAGAGAANPALGASAAAVRPQRPPALATTRSLATVVAQLDLIRNRMLDAQQHMNRYDVEIQKKFALAAACVVFVILGVPVALRFPRGGVGLVIGVSFAVFALYYVGLIAGESLADRLLLSPFWAMWLANVVFTIAGMALLLRVRKESGSTRGGDTRELLENIRIWIIRQLHRLKLLPERRKVTA